MNTLKVLIGVILLGLAAAWAQQTQPGADTGGQTAPKFLGETDKKFLKDAAIGNMAEVQLGELAQQKANASEVKQFGGQMVRDHSAAQDQLKNLAQTQQVALPTGLDPKHNNAKARLSKLSGAQFDRAYITLMVQEHTEDVQKFQKEASTAHDPTVKQFAATTLPTLQQHLSEAKGLQGQLQSGAIQ